MTKLLLIKSKESKYEYLVLHSSFLSGTFEKISWASVQLHCQRYVNEQKVNLQQQVANAKSADALATNVEIVPLDSTALIATKGETGQTVYTSKPCVLFCDLKLQPGETRTCTIEFRFSYRMNAVLSSFV